jgi:RimJ/RimL family protein N-acetyltransferase
LKLVSQPFSAEIARWVADQVGGADWGPCEAIGVADKDDNLIGGVVFNNYQPQYRNIEVSFASIRANWLTPTLCTGILSYAFDQLGCNRITSLTPKRNRRARQFLQKFGFCHEGTIRYGYGNDHTIISGLLASEWAEHRFNRNRVNEQAKSAASTRPRNPR